MKNQKDVLRSICVKTTHGMKPLFITTFGEIRIKSFKIKEIKKIINFLKELIKKQDLNNMI